MMTSSLKVCSVCKKEKPTDSFPKDRTRASGLFPQCKSCRKTKREAEEYRTLDRAGKRRRYAENPGQTAYTKRLIERNIAYVLALKEAPCTDCDVQYPTWVMHFDHVRGVKKNSIGLMVRKSHSIATIQAEIDKCELVCANCHAHRTHMRRGGVQI